MTSRTVIALQPGEGPPPPEVAPLASPVAPSVGETRPADFEPQAWQELQAYLFQELPHGSQVILIQGPRGSGKSSFLRCCLARAPSDWEIVSLQARSATGERQLVMHLQRLLQAQTAQASPSQASSQSAPEGEPAFGQAHSGPRGADTAWDEGTELAHGLLARAREPSLFVLMVDDAQRLSPFALRWLLLMKQAVVKRGGRLGILLFAEPDIERLLNTPSIVELCSDALHRLALPPFDSEDSVAFARLYLGESLGEAWTEALDEHRLRVLHRLSGGRPGALCTLLEPLRAGRPVALPWGARLAVVTARYKALLASLAAFALLVGGYLVYRMPPAPTPAPLSEAASETTVMATIQGTGIEAAAAGAMPGGSREKEQDVGTVTGRGSPPGPLQEQMRSQQPQIPATTALLGDSAVEVREEGGQAARGHTPGATMEISKAVRATAAAPKSAGTPKSSESSNANLSMDIPPVRGSDWILEQDAKSFTVQLTSWADKQRAIRYIRDNRLQNDAAYVHTRSRGKDWYLVVYRTYPSLKAARQAIEQLPEHLKKYSPWVRNVSSLQALAVID